MTKTVPERIQHRITDLDGRIAIMCAENLADSDIVTQAQWRIRKREETVGHMRTEIEIIRMGIAAWFCGDDLVIEPQPDLSDQRDAAIDPSSLDPAEPPTAQSQILRLLAEANRPMKAREIITTFSDRYGETSITSALSRLKRNQLIAHLSESHEWAIR